MQGIRYVFILLFIKLNITFEFQQIHIWIYFQFPVDVDK